MKKEKLEHFTEAEFLEYVRHLQMIGYRDEKEDIEAVAEFERLTEHPSGSDLLFYPDPSRPDTPEGVVEEIKAWRAANGKPGFKQA